jgi:hypothetical protein
VANRKRKHITVPGKRQGAADSPGRWSQKSQTLKSWELSEPEDVRDHRDGHEHAENQHGTPHHQRESLIERPEEEAFVGSGHPKQAPA